MKERAVRFQNWRNRIMFLIRLRLLLSVFISFCIFPQAIAGTFTVFGPETIERATGKPVVVNIPFSAPAVRSDYLFQLESNQVASGIIGINGQEVVGASEFNQNASSLYKSVSLANNNKLSVELRGKPGGTVTITVLGVDNVLPSIDYIIEPTANSAGWHNEDVTITFTCDDDYAGIASCTDPITVSTEGESQTFIGTAVDNAGNENTVEVIVNLDKTSPVIFIQNPSNNTITNEDTIFVTGSVSDANSITSLTVNGEVVALDSNNNLSHPVLLSAGSNVIAVLATDIADNVSDSVVNVTYDPGTVGEIPPDPTEVASPISTTSNTMYVDSIAFLYSGSNPIQTGVSENTIQPLQASVIRGKVMDVDRNPIAGVTVSIQGHSE